MTLRSLLTATALASCLAALTGPAAMAAEPDSCKNIHMADVGWTDNTAQNGLFNQVVTGLGYQTKIDVLALPVILESLKSGKLDLFLDNWMPSNAPNLQPYLDAKSLESLKPDLKGAGYGPVVPDYVAAAGVKDIKDLGPNGDKFDHKFYGIEPGNDGNKIVQKKIDDPASGLKGWKLVESSEQGMLVEAKKDMAAKKWIVFLGWAPHPVMGKMPLVYLTGFEQDGFGDAQVNPLTRNGYSAQCPNIGKLLSNLEFTLPMESSVMEDIGAPNNMSGDDAAKKWLKANPDVLSKWLDGVTAVDGGDGQAAVKKYLGL
jgi:glycine betaine/proline transport system substrate-binding protein